MNKRIKELAEQAGLVQGGWANADKVKIWKEDPDNPGSLEKFAELIVRECSQFVEDKFDFCGDELIIAEQILKHFGIEE